MASSRKRIEVILGARDASQRVFDGYEARFDRVKRTVVGLAASVGAALGTREALRFVRGNLAAFDEQERAVSSLRQAMADAGDSSEASLRRFLDFASGFQEVTEKGDEGTIALGAYLATIGQLTGEGLRDATKATLGLSRATGMGAEMMGRAYLNALEGNYSMLDRYVPALRTATSEEEKAELVRGLVSRGLNQLEADAKTASGQVKQLTNDWGDFREELGGDVAPVIERTAAAGRDLLSWVRASGSEIGTVITVLGTGSAALGGVRLAMLGVNVASKSMLGVNVADAWWSVRNAAVGSRISMARLTGATLAQAAAAGVLRVATIALQVSLTAGLAVGLGIVATAFIRSRKEGGSFSEEMRLMVVSVGLLSSRFDDMQSAARTAAEAARDVVKAERELSAANELSSRLAAQEALTLAIEAQVEAKKKEVAATKVAESSDLKQMERRLAVLQKTKKEQFFQSTTRKLADARVLGATSQFGDEEATLERIRKLKAKLAGEAVESAVVLKLETQLGEAKAGLAELREEAGRVPEIELVSEAQKGGVFAFLKRMREQVVEVQRQAEAGVRLGDDVLAFTGSPVRNELRAIEREADGLVRRIQTRVGQGLADQAAAERDIASVRAAEREKSRETIRDGFLELGGGGQAEVEVSEPSRSGVEALEISRRFLGIADSFGQGQADPAERAAAAAEKSAAEQAQTRELMQQTFREFLRLVPLLGGGGREPGLDGALGSV